MSKEILNILFLAGMFLSLFAIAEVLYHKFNIEAESTRKIVHAGTGIITMLFPVFFQSQWPVLLLCASFAIVLLLSLRFHLLPSVNAIERASYGSLLYPLSVYICFLSYTYFHDILFFYLPVLTMAICDPIAALVGKRWPWKKFKIKSATKTVMGSLAFFISSFILSIVLFYLFSPGIFINKNLLFIAMLIALLAAGTEALSSKGTDNITIPVCVLIVLTLMNV